MAASVKDALAEDKNYVYPSEWVSPATKLTEEWGLDYMRAIYSEWLKNTAVFLKTRQTDIIRCRRYAEGDQSEDIYKSRILMNKGKSWVNLSWEIMAIIPKYLDIMVGYFMSLNERISADALDEDASDKRNQDKALMQAKVILKDHLNKMSQMMGQIPKDDPNSPQTLQEVNHFMEYIHKLPEEAIMEEMIQLISQLNDLDTETKRAFIYGLLVDGEAGLMRYRDEWGKIKIENVDFLENIVGFSKRKDRKDMTKVGRFHYMTLGEIRQQAPKFKKTDYDAIALNYFGLWDNYLSREQYFKDYKFGDFPYEYMRVKVMEVQFLTTNDYLWERRKNRHGETTIAQLPFNGKVENGNESVRRAASVWMKGKWIVGTDYIFDYGLLERQVRGDVNNPLPKISQDLSDARCEFHYYRPFKKSIVMRMIPFADGAQLGWLKYQNSLAKARPKGLAMDLSSLDNVKDGKTTYTPLQLRAIYDETGDYLYRSEDSDDPDMSRHPAPFKELDGGAGPILEEAIGAINFNLEMLGKVAGMEDIMNGTLPNPRTAVATAKMTASQTTNGLSVIYNAWLSTKEDLIQCVGQMIQDDADDGVLHEGYIQVFGDKLKYVKGNKDLSLYNMGIRIWPNPSEEEVVFLEKLVEESLQQRISTGTGGIELEDAFAIRELMKTSIKAAEELLMMRRDLRKRQDAQAINEAAQAKASSDQASASAASQMSMVADNNATNNKIKVIQAQGNEMRKTNQLLGKQKLDQIDLTGAQKGSHILQKGELDQAEANMKSLHELTK